MEGEQQYLSQVCACLWSGASIRHLVACNYKVVHVEMIEEAFLWEAVLRGSPYFLSLSWATPAKPWHLVLVFARLPEGRAGVCIVRHNHSEKLLRHNTMTIAVGNRMGAVCLGLPFQRDFQRGREVRGSRCGYRSVWQRLAISQWTGKQECPD